MVYTIDSSVSFLRDDPSSAQREGSKQDAVHRFNTQLGFFRLPNKVISTLMGWGELLPLNESVLNHLSERRTTIKTMSATFAVPKFFTKQIKLYQSCQNFIKNLNAERDLEQKINDAKKIFYAFLGVVISAMKMPLLLHKTRIIDLKRISDHLPGELKRGSAVLALAVACMHMGENSRAFARHLNKSQISGYSDFKEILASKKGKKLGVKFISSVFKSGLACMGAASLFFGWYVPPLLLMTASTISFTISLTSKMPSNAKIMLGKRGGMQLNEDFGLLV